jgi:hypothetical protein
MREVFRCSVTIRIYLFKIYHLPYRNATQLPYNMTPPRKKLSSCTSPPSYSPGYGRAGMATSHLDEASVSRRRPGTGMPVRNRRLVRRLGTDHPAGIGLGLAAIQRHCAQRRHRCAGIPTSGRTRPEPWPVPPISRAGLSTGILVNAVGFQTRSSGDKPANQRHRRR